MPSREFRKKEGVNEMEEIKRKILKFCQLKEIKQ